MSAATRRPFRGRLDAVGFLIDPGHVGAAEARRRVVEAWSAGARLLDLDGCLLLLLPEAVSVRAELAPGLPVLAQDGRLVVRRHGDDLTIDAERLGHVPLSTIVDVADLRLDVLGPAPGVPRPAPPVEYATIPDATSVRSRAGIGRPSQETARRAASLVDELSSRVATGDGRERRRWLRPPVTPMVRRRHARYLDQLTRSFAGRDWDEALRSAISLGGTGRGALTTRLPGRRSGQLRPGTEPPGGSTQVPYGPTVHQHLRDLYTTAAAELEAAGQIVRAAFVHADLLDNPTAAIDVLERHAHYAEGAELAEARGQDPAVAVRLWWRAGDRQRAIRVAGSRGAYAAAVSRLEQVDAEAAVELRRSWMHDRREAGDPLGAIAAAWPAESLRPETMPDIAAAVARGGSTGGEALAHWLALAPVDEAVAIARTLLGDDAETEDARRAFVTALSAHPVGDPAWDRELTSSALLTLARGSAAIPGKVFHDVSARLQRRADPLLVADLPRIKVPLREPGAPQVIDLSTTGSVVVHDAVAIGAGSVLVALGELGVRLVTLDGRVRARWDVPTHRIVVADHGGRALLITDRMPRYDVHRLDLPQGRPVRLPALDALPLDTYDGRRPVLVSDRGLEWVEQAGDRWRVVWRELTEPGQQVHQVSRTESALAALFTEFELHVFQWELPSLMLRQRGTVEPAQSVVLLATGEAGRLHQESGVAALDWHSPYGHRLTASTFHPDGDSFVWVSGSAFLVGDRSDERVRLALYPRRDAPEAATVVVPPGQRPLLRSFGGRITTGHAAGRVVVIDAASNEVTADITLRI